MTNLPSLYVLDKFIYNFYINLICIQWYCCNSISRRRETDVFNNFKNK